MGTTTSNKRRKCTNRGKCSYQQYSSENIFGTQRGEKGMDTRSSSAWWTSTWSREEQHQTRARARWVVNKVLVSMEGKLGGCKGARGDTGASSGVGVGTENMGSSGWWWGSIGGAASGVFTHVILCVHHRTHPHQGVDERQSPIGRCKMKQGPLAL